MPQNAMNRSYTNRSPSNLRPRTCRSTRRPPRPAAEPLLTRSRLLRILSGAVVMAAGTLAVFVWGGRVFPGASVQVGGLPDGRTYVYYLPEQSLSWQYFDRWPGLQVRRLSEDPATGRLAVSARFPPGWTLAAAPASAELPKVACPQV